VTKLPAIQFYPGDWKKDPGVQALSFHDRGVWFEILLLMHESDRRGVLLLNGAPMPDEALARLLGLDNQNLEATLTKLLAYGVVSREDGTGALVSRRMVRDEQLRQIRKTAGSKGGNPVLVNQNPTTQVKQNPTPSSSTSTSTSTSVVKEEDVLPVEESLTAAQVVVTEWNVGAPKRCMRLTPARRKVVASRLRDPWWRDNWREGLARLPTARFLWGENDSGWKADFDWFIKPDSLTKILEGKYDSGAKSNRQLPLVGLNRFSGKAAAGDDSPGKLIGGPAKEFPFTEGDGVGAG
jgi:hypothetical protein